MDKYDDENYDPHVVGKEGNGGETEEYVVAPNKAEANRIRDMLTRIFPSKFFVRKHGDDKK